MGGRGSVSMTAWATGVGGASVDITDKYMGMSLSEAENTLRGIKGHEEAVVFDKKMNVIAAYSGGTGSVAIPETLKKKDDITITHNHPTGDADYGATFSPADVSWFGSSRAKEIRAVGAGQGEYIYSLRTTGKQSAVSTKYEKTQLNAWAHKVIADATPKSQGGTGKLQARYRKEYNKFRNQGKSPEASRHAAWQVATGVLERSLANKVHSLGNGTIYFSRNRSYNVNR